MKILVLNPGSSTLKFGLYDVSEQAVALLKSGTEDLKTARPDAISDATRQVITPLEEKPEALGCRVVHGGEKFLQTTRVTPDVLAEIRALGTLAPLHNPLSAAALEAALQLLPETPAVAVFDTAFHRTLPAVARTYALPYELSEQHALWRYGFHGIAHQNISERLRAHLEGCRVTGVGCRENPTPETEHQTPQEPIRHPTPDTRHPLRLITCHLGSGASVCAIRNGESIDTSMGLTPMEGLVMGTRSGDIDPGLLLYLQNEIGMTAKDLDGLLNKKSGLLGLSGVSNDLRDIEKAASEGNERAALAMEIFAYRVAKTIGAYAVALEGFDALAFSGGIGEHSATMRNRICRRLVFLGLLLDPARNAETNPADIYCISADDSKITAYIVPADENAQIAHETFQLLSKKQGVGVRE
jgi:acetate kinase